MKKSLLTTAALAPLAALAQQAVTEKPNIIFILCDDMGYGDLACYGQPYIHTPNIDRLASEGMRFTQAYAGSPVSAPSRATIMTGQHTGHTHVRGNLEYWKNRPNVTYGKSQDPDRVGQEPYDANHIILPEIMKKNGYATGMFGKWAGGYEGSVSTPDKRGVDEYYGYICQYMAHMYYPNFLNRYSKRLGDTETVRVELTENTQYTTANDDYANRTQYSSDLIHREALDWIDRQEEGQPFYGFFTYTLPHAELYQPNDSILQAYKQRFCDDITFAGVDRYHANTNMHAQFAAMITRLDAYVGEIMQHLKGKGLDKNTLVIFSSDNGPHEEGGADPTFFGRDGKLKGLKRSCNEGGIRIPFIAWWPGHVPAGTVNDHQLAFYDILPTFCELLGTQASDYLNPDVSDDCFDGISFAPTLLGNDKEQKDHNFLYWEFHETNQIGVRQGNWKLIYRNGASELYDLATDLHEDNNVASQYPEVVNRLVQIIKEQHVESSQFKVSLPN
jgi:arylsulfatase A-like enzyme